MIEYQLVVGTINKEDVEMKRQVFFTAIIVVVLSVAVGTNAYTIHPTHPRIFITDRQAFRDRINNDVNLRSIFDSSKANMSWRTPGTNNWVNPVIMQMHAMIYLVDQEAAYLDKTKLFLEYFANGDWELDTGSSSRHWIWPLIVKSMSITYDWLYDDLSPAEKTKYGNFIVTTADKIYTYCRNVPPGASWIDQCMDYSNQFFWHHGRLIFAGIALYNDGINDSSAIGYLDDSENWIKNHMLPATNQVGMDGGWCEGLGYNGMTIPMFADMIEVWKVAAGEDLFGSSTFLHYNSEWILHSITPHNGYYVEIADIGISDSYGTTIGLMAVLTAARYSNGFAQYITEDVFPSSYGFHNFPYLLWYDSGVPAVNLSGVELAKHFRGIGHVLMRTGFDSDSTFALFKSGNMYAPHQHQEQNEFLIHRKGSLAVESAHYEGDYYNETFYHNCMLIDGDQIRPPFTQYYEVVEGTVRDAGDITEYEHTADYTYAVGDAANAYESSKVTECLRYFVFLRPDYFVVFDRVSATSASYAKKWLIHSVNSPSIAGDLITITESNGKLFSKTILPEQVNINSYSEESRYGIEVTPVTSNADELFLHVLYPTDLAGTMPSTSAVGNSDMTGVNFDDRLILFGKEGKVYNDDFSYSFSAASTTKHLIADMKPDTSYIITTGADYIEKRSSSNGVLYFETTDTGAVTVDITKLAGDVDIDFDVDLHDFGVMAPAWLSEPLDGNWNRICDISEPNDDIINYTDIEMLFRKWLVGAP